MGASMCCFVSVISCLIGYDELVTAPVLVTPIRKVPADDDGNLSAPVGREQTRFMVIHWEI